MSTNGPFLILKNDNIYIKNQCVITIYAQRELLLNLRKDSRPQRNARLKAGFDLLPRLFVSLLRRRAIPLQRVVDAG